MVNPLFLEQLFSHAEESVEAVPGSVQSLVQARLDRLEPADKAALQAASVLGQRFTLDELRHLIQSPNYACGAPVAHHLVRREGEEMLFAHPLIRDAVYDSLLKARRQELHRWAADWFAGRDQVVWTASPDPTRRSAESGSAQRSTREFLPGPVKELALVLAAGRKHRHA